MRNSSKDLSIFDFKTDEDKLSKYQFLATFTSDYCQFKQPDVSELAHNDLHEVDSPERSTPDRKVTSTEEKSELDDVKALSTSYHKHTKTCNSDFRPGSLVQEGLVMGASTILLASVFDDEVSELHSSEVPVNLMSDEEGSCTSASETSSASGDLPESHPDCPALEHYHSACEKMDDNKNTVVVCPDYVNYRDTLFLESQLTFCADCIKIECSDASRADERLIFVCDIADIIRIGCQWSRSVEALLFKFWIRTNVGRDVDKFIASIADMSWSEKEQKIMSLAERYKDIWDTLPDNNYALEDDMFRTSFSKRYFTEIMEPFEDVIYPKGDPDAVSISKRDIELLEPDTFINDTIIDFYIKYLQDKVQPNEKERFHFFNSFFFRKLADLDKDPGSISEGREAFQRVRKWTRKLNIFEKDYIFIPVNFNLHWSLLVICHPGEIVTFKDDDVKNSSKVPCILHMDSIKGSHNGLKNLIQSYLLEEWKGRHPKLPDDITLRFSNLRFVSLELPQQENSSDCGLFLLHYVELFLEEAPVYFNPTRITKLSNFLSADWFPPAEASFKRFHIRGLLYELLRDSSQKLTPTCSNVDFPCSGDDVDQAVEFLSAEDSPSKLANGSTSMPPHTDLDDNFEQTAAVEHSSTTCLMEDHGGVKTHTTEHLDGVGTEDSLEGLVPVIMDVVGCQPPVARSTSQICSTSYCVNDLESCELPCTFEQVKEAVVDTLYTRSNDQLAISTERDETYGKAERYPETQKPASPVVDGYVFVPDTPNTSVEKLEEYVKNSQEMDSKVEVEMLDDTRGMCGDVDHHCGSDEQCLKNYANDTEGRQEECEKADASETENGKAEHRPESNLTIDGGRKVDDSCLAENLDGGDQEMSSPEKGGEFADSQENNIIKKMSKENTDGCKEDLLCHDSALVEVISMSNDFTRSKRNKNLGSMQQVSKRRKVEQLDMRRRVTRSSSKEFPS